MDETKEKIIIAARKVFAEKGYSLATIKDIAAEAGVARGLLHYHFKNKEDLLIQMMVSIYEGTVGPEVMDQLGAGTPRQLAATTTLVLREALENTPEFFQLIYGTINVVRQSETGKKAMADVWGAYRKNAEASIERLKASGAIISNQSADVIITMLIAVVHGIGIQVVGEPHLKLTKSKALWDAVEQNVLYILTN